MAFFRIYPTSAFLKYDVARSKERMMMMAASP